MQPTRSSMTPFSKTFCSALWAPWCFIFLSFLQLGSACDPEKKDKKRGYFRESKVTTFQHSFLADAPNGTLDIAFVVEKDAKIDPPGGAGISDELLPLLREQFADLALQLCHMTQVYQLQGKDLNWSVRLSFVHLNDPNVGGSAHSVKTYKLHEDGYCDALRLEGFWNTSGTAADKFVHSPFHHLKPTMLGSPNWLMPALLNGVGMDHVVNAVDAVQNTLGAPADSLVTKKNLELAERDWLFKKKAGKPLHGGAAYAYHSHFNNLRNSLRIAFIESLGTLDKGFVDLTADDFPVLTLLEKTLQATKDPQREWAPLWVLSFGRTGNKDLPQEISGTQVTDTFLKSKRNPVTSGLMFFQNASAMSRLNSLKTSLKGVLSLDRLFIADLNLHAKGHLENPCFFKTNLGRMAQPLAPVVAGAPGNIPSVFQAKLFEEWKTMNIPPFDANAVEKNSVLDVLLEVSLGNFFPMNTFISEHLRQTSGSDESEIDLTDPLLLTSTGTTLSSTDCSFNKKIGQFSLHATNLKSFTAKLHLTQTTTMTDDDDEDEDDDD